MVKPVMAKFIMRPTVNWAAVVAETWSVTPLGSRLDNGAPLSPPRSEGAGEGGFTRGRCKRVSEWQFYGRSVLQRGHRIESPFFSPGQTSVSLGGLWVTS